MEFDGSALAEELFRAYLKQILVDGFSTPIRIRQRVFERRLSDCAD
jgi:hypothetical protein